MLDIVFSAILIVLLFPLMVIIGALIRIDSSGGAIFKQKRMGRNLKEFTCYKFRTMKKDAPRGIPAKELTDPERYVTRVGKFLRRSSLDELPQLFNVLCGDMSLVGPRPLIISEREVHTRRAKLGVYELRPGITGLAQIAGRDDLCDDEKIRLDAEYKDRCGFIVDMKIIFCTVFKVLSCEGIAIPRREEGS
jgi:O-antigen biosynthesis protein WbqP